MISATDLKSGTTFLIDKTPYQVIRYTHQKIGRGGANVKLVLRNLETGVSEEKTLASSLKVDGIKTVKKPMQYLYKDEVNAVFMEGTSFEQVEIPLSVVGRQIIFVKEGSNVDVCFWEDRALSVELSAKVTLEVTDAAPGIKGNSATNIYKPARLENGLRIKVPLFIKVGDKVRVDTRSGEYVERVSS